MYFAILFVVSTAFANVIPKDYSLNYYYRDFGPYNNIYKSENERIKRELEVNTNPDETYSITAKKDVLIDKNNKVDIKGTIDSLDPRDSSYKNFGGEIGYTNRKGSLSVSAQHSKDIGDELSAKGNLNLIDSKNHKLDAHAFADVVSSDDVHSRYGGNLDYSNRNGDSATLSATHDSKFGDQLGAVGKFTFIDNDKHNLNALGSLTKTFPLDKSPSETAFEGSLNYAHRNGHEASLSGQHIPNVADELSAAGKLNLLHTDNHNLDLSGQISRTFPLDNTKNFNTYSGNLDYLYKDKLGANLGVQHSDLFSKTDYSAAGKLNIFRDRDTSFDAFAGISKSISPRYESPWSPNFGIMFKKSF